MRRFPLRALAAVVVLGMGVTACSDGNDAEAPVETPVPNGQRLTVKPVAVADVATVPAIITTRDMAEVRARIPGVLTNLGVRAGDRVAAGQRIGTVTDTRLAQDEAALGASVAAAEAQAAQAAAALKRIRFLHAERVYADARLEEAVAAARAAEAAAAAARAQQGAVSAVAGQGALLAPAAGRILRADVPAGSAVAPGMVIATVTAGPAVVRMDVPESLASRMSAGASVRISASAGQSGADERQGRISRIYPAVSQGRVRVDATVPGLDPALVDQRVTAQVTLGERMALAVPASFIATRFGLNFATLVMSDGKRASDVPVEVRALGDGRQVEILSGLKAGDVLVAPAKAAQS